jgi:cytochrome c556
MKKTIGLCLLAFGTMAFAAEPTAEDLIKYRQSVMGAIGKHMGASNQILKGQVGYKHLQVHADALASLFGIAGDIFPANSQKGETNALPRIWKKPDEFTKALTRAKDAATAYKTAVAGGDAAKIGKAFGTLGSACKGCHDDFRKPLE